MSNLIPIERIEDRILMIRGQKVMIDKDLAELYGVETKYLNRQVKRNIDRFPKEFMFQLTARERKELVTNWHRFKKLKHSTSNPFAFTEHGVAMLSSVLNSKKAVQVNILIIKTFIKLRRIMSTHISLANKITELERKYNKHDVEISAVFKVLKKLMSIEEKPRKRIGFLSDRNSNKEV
ncbi:MAG: ORF6N domain-containing protein [Candidatus Saganbacteria bacterium]|nr:ORF6N domain-containing protein [Candidatus Saganbacteria bacterium]